jgi:antitoxin component of MazEF toxin-antitoxin module
MKTLRSTIGLWGQSAAVSIPPEALRACGLHIGQAVEMELSGRGTLTVRAAPEFPDLDALLAGITPENLPNAADTEWGKPEGSEIW